MAVTVRIENTVRTAVTAGTAATTRIARSEMTPRQYLSLAEAGVTRAGQNNAWGDPNFNWYDELLNDTARSPQATIWGVVALWETVDYNAMADPSSANLDLVKHFANKAETYLDSNVTPAPGVRRTTPAYTPYPGSTNDPETFFDDNAWFSLAFMDAYEVETQAGNSGLASRYLGDAVQGFDFIRDNGWDNADGGGLYWNTRHEIPAGEGRSGEALGAATDVAARLYQATGNPGYLATAVKYITWANNNILKRDGSYAESISNEITMPHDGEGAMIAAFTTLCQANAGTVPSSVYAQVPPNKDHGGDFTFRLPGDPTSWCSWAQGLAHHTAFGVTPGTGRWTASSHSAMVPSGTPSTCEVCSRSTPTTMTARCISWRPARPSGSSQTPRGRAGCS